MIRDITIRAALNGWIAAVGCQTLVYDNTQDLLTDLEQYLYDPDATEAEFIEHGMNAKHTYVGAALTPTTACDVAGPSASENCVRTWEETLSHGRGAGRRNQADPLR